MVRRILAIKAELTALYSAALALTIAFDLWHPTEVQMVALAGAQAAVYAALAAWYRTGRGSLTPAPAATEADHPSTRTDGYYAPPAPPTADDDWHTTSAEAIAQHQTRVAAERDALRHMPDQP